MELAKEIVYLLATRAVPSLEGQDWEQIFARIVNARWKPTNVGLDDVVLEQTAWSAKTVKHKSPSTADKVRLISGRNSPSFSFGKDNILSEKPSILGEMVLAIWNERVSAVRCNYNHLRTVVLVKSDDLLELSLFEYNTVMYQHEKYDWEWNAKGNLEGHDQDGQKKFTWQPSGSQFTITESIPNDRLAIVVKQPPTVSKEAVLNGVGFDNSWYEVLKNRSDL